MKSFKLFVISIFLICATTLLRVNGLTAQLEQEPYKKVIPNNDPQAKCLDGSPGGIYIHQGTQKKNFLIFLIGGGTCAGKDTISDAIDSCWKRSKTMLGSSTLYPNQIVGQGMLSTNPQISAFAQWTKVLFLYCDGTMFSGMRKEPVEYKGQKIYFRANTMMRANLKYLDQKYGLSTADHVVFSGASAGAVGAWTWANYVKKMIKTPNPYVLDVIIDAGLFVNKTTYSNNTYSNDIGLKTQYKVANVDQGIQFELCVQKYATEPYKCLFLENAFSAIETRTLFFNTPYDPEQLQVQMGLRCIKDGSSGQTFKDCNAQQMKYVQQIADYRRGFVNNLKLFSRFSIWSISCAQHCWTPFKDFWDSTKQRIPMNSEHSAKDAVERFVINRQRVMYIDNVKWPNNAPCAY